MRNRSVCLLLGTTSVLRKTLTILSLIGLLLSVGLWGVSYFHILYVPSQSPKPAIVLRGGLVALTTVTVGAPLGFQCEGYRGLNTWWLPPRNEFYVSGPLGWRLAVPLWLPIMVLISLMIVTNTPIRRRKCKKLGLCLRCGYDLRGSSKRCLECGDLFEKQ
jgi:hypothetical protein